MKAFRVGGLLPLENEAFERSNLNSVTYPLTLIPLFAEDRILDQGLNHRSNLESERKPLPKGVLTDNRVLKPGLDVDRHFAYLDRPSGEEPDGDVPFVP